MYPFWKPKTRSNNAIQRTAMQLCSSKPASARPNTGCPDPSNLRLFVRAECRTPFFCKCSEELPTNPTQAHALRTSRFPLRLKLLQVLLRDCRDVGMLQKVEPELVLALTLLLLLLLLLSSSICLLVAVSF
jgi:hypothetical protein